MSIRTPACGWTTREPVASQPATNLYALLAIQARRDPDGIAILAPRRTPLAFGALLDQIDYIRTTLNGCDVRRQDRIALIAGRGPETAVAELGIASCATCIPLNSAATRAELKQALVQTKAKALFVPVTTSAEVKDLASGLGVPLLEYLVEKGAPAGRFRIIDRRPVAVPHGDFPTPGEVAFVLRTSGTTTRAKVVPVSHGNIVARADKSRRMLGLSPGDLCLNLMPFCYAHGLYTGLLAPLAAGCAVICPPAFDVETFLACMRDFLPTWYTASFTYHQAIFEWLEQRPNALGDNRLRFVRSGSGPLPDRVRLGLEEIFGAPVLDVYSTTETGAIAANSPVDLRKPGMVGRSPNDDIAIMDANGNILGPGTEGELVVYGSTVFGGYENDPAANERAFRNGWYRTGDQGFIDAEGYVKLLGRLDDVINRGGEKIAPREVDEVLLAHPAVAEAVSFPVPHGRLHQDIAAAIVPHNGSQVTGDELRRFLARRLTAFKVPHVILCVAELPKGPTGKLVRTDLAAHFGLGAEVAPSRVQPPTKYHEMLLALWREVLKRQDIGCDDDFFQLGGDSLSAMDLLHRIEGEFEYKLPITMLVEAPTVSRFADRIEVASLGAKSSAVPIQTNGTQRPLFAVSGRWGHVIRLLPLLRSLGSDQPCYGLQPPKMDWSHVSCTTLPQMAAHYVSEVKALQPHGPYRLFGLSFGGLVVFEMALQLQRMGEAVEFLGILDADPPTCLFEYGVDIAGSDWGEAERRDSINQRLAETHLWARSNYILDNRLEQNLFRDELTFFYCTGNPIVAEHDRRRLWRRFADRFRLLPLPGPHGGADREPQSAALENLLRACINGTAPAGCDPAAIFDRAYRIESRNKRESIISSMGDVYQIEQDRVQGYVDAVKVNAETIHIRGWAVEPCQRQPAQTIAVFLGDRFLGYGASGVSTPETAKQIAENRAQYAGFDFLFRRDAAPDATGRPRLFVLSGDHCAAELGFSIEHELATLRAELAQLRNERDTPVRTLVSANLGELSTEAHWIAARINHGNPAVVETTETPWGYSATLPLARLREKHRSCGDSLFWEVEVEVLDGDVGVSLIDHDTLIAERILKAADGRKTIYLPAVASEADLMIRNGPNDGKSKIAIYDVRLMAPCDAPGVPHNNTPVR